MRLDADFRELLDNPDAVGLTRHDDKLTPANGKRRDPQYRFLKQGSVAGQGNELLRT
jgi:hypothetical protein